MNIALKLFVFLLITSSTSSFALGLGDVNLKSNLGERLNAKISVFDTESAPESSCFTVSDTNEPPAFKKAEVTLSKTTDHYTLNINSSEVITEPIINLRVAVHCESNINREYVLLLDPASINEEKPTPIAQAVVIISEENPTKSKSKVRTKKTPTTSQTEIEPITEQVTQPAKNKKHKKNKTESSIDKSLMEAYTGKPQTSKPNQNSGEKAVETNHSNQNSATSKPYLTISGGNSSNAPNNIPNLSLRLETQIDFSRVDPAPAVLDPAEVIDEVTVMTNRLAHLEKQILTLQSQNNRLKIEAQRNNESLNWSKILPSKQSVFLSLLVLSALAGVAWLRRKILHRRLSSEQAHWFDAEMMKEPLDDIDELSSKKSSLAKELVVDAAKNTNGDTFEEGNANLFAYPTAFTVNDNNDNESVLDHAEVFIAHDRPAMAIQLLQNHLVDLPVESPEIWLKLISLLAEEGTEEEYDKAVTACKQFFNVKIPSFANATDIDESSIEDYPHIVARLQEVWGSEFAVEFLNDLIYNKQSQPREGFGRKTFEELFALKQIAISLHASNKSSSRLKPNIEIEVPEKSAHIEPTNSIADTQIGKHVIEDKLTAESFFDAPDAVEEDIEVSFSADNNTETVKNTNDLDLELTTLFAPKELPEIKHNPKTEALELALNSPTLDINAPLEAEEIDFSSFLGDITIEHSTQATPSPTEVKDSPETFIVLEESSASESLETANDVTPKAVEAETKKQTAPLTIEWELPKLDK